MTRVIPRTSEPYHPVLCAPLVEAPTLFMVALEDETVHADYTADREAFEHFSGPKEWCDIAGGHFGLLYYPGELFDETSEVQTQFFKKWLSVISYSDAGGFKQHRVRETSYCCYTLEPISSPIIL